MHELIDWLHNSIERLAGSLPEWFWLQSPMALREVLMVVLVGLVCGAVGSLVVVKRMAFFSDALAHCAFAGVTLGMILSLAGPLATDSRWTIQLVMVVFGILVGVGIAFVKENSSLANDTVIGVFFAFAVGFGGMLMQALSHRIFVDPEAFLFGGLLYCDEADMLVMAGLLVVLIAALVPAYNAVVLSSISPSLARSRGIHVRVWNYFFIVLLAVIVNLSIKAVGALLINAMLVVPAATAANVARDIRGMFWRAMAVAIGCGIVGVWVSCVVEWKLPRREPFSPAAPGAIVVFCVFCFFLSLTLSMIRSRRTPRIASAP